MRMAVRRPFPAVRSIARAGGIMGRVIELDDPADLAAAAGGDALIVWAGQGLRPGVRAWAGTLGAASGEASRDAAPDAARGLATGGPGADAVAVACRDLSRRDRLAVCGTPRAVARLLRDVVPQVGPGFRPVGDEALLAALAGAVPGLVVEAGFVWMDTAAPVPGGAGVAWLPEADLPEVRALLDRAAPDSYARPGGTGVRRWAGWRDPGGALLAVAADAWSAPEVGFLAGVATDPRARGRGLAGAVCAFVTNALLVEHGRVGLMVDDWNTGALAVYRRLGFRLRRVAAARLD